MLKLLLTAAIPFQRIVDSTSPTHGFINRQALAILRADGQQGATWLGWYLDSFNQGCDWADGGWRNVGHMYDPQTGTGLKGWPSAPELMQDYWENALRLLAESNLPRAFFYLGAAAHLVQDLCVPHHAAARVFGGHREFEAFARRYYQRFVAHDGGSYSLARTAAGWVTANADYTRKHYSHCIDTELDPSLLTEAVADLLPRAQRTTAGLIAHFAKTAGLSARAMQRSAAMGVL